MVYYSTPYKDGDIGGGINDFVALLPPAAWVCVRDADTLFLTSTQQLLIQRIAKAEPEFDVIGAMTNRIRAPYQLHCGEISEETRIDHHIAIARRRECLYGVQIQSCPWPVAGFFMLFRKSTWEAVGGFKTRTAYFDKEFTKDVIRTGGSLGVAPGLYLWHTYRLGSEDPVNHVDHLRGAGL